MKQQRVIWKIVVGTLLVISFGANIRLYFGGGTQANAALATSFVVIFGGFYLIYKGLYPSK